MDYVGVLCVEFFVLDDGRLLANEIAPRPHNSGHYTIDACVSSQFDQQARVLAGQPLGDTEPAGPGRDAQRARRRLVRRRTTCASRTGRAVLAVPGAKLHLYGKSEARRGRKMGHVTCIASNSAGSACPRRTGGRRARHRPRRRADPIWSRGRLT